MTEQIKSKFDIGDHLQWRGIFDRPSGTGKVFKLKLVQDTKCLYYFKYLIENDITEEREWFCEYEVKKVGNN